MFASPALVKNLKLPALSPELLEKVQRAKQYAVQESVKFILQKQQAAAAAAAAANSAGLAGANPASSADTAFTQKQQAIVLMCRVYVGSIYYDLKEEVVRTAFAPFGPFKSVNMSFDPTTGKHKGFAFIEYECPEAAQLALEHMGGYMLGGRPIKVGRPANMSQNHPMIDVLLEESKSMKRLYVGSVHPDLTTDDLKSVFSAFGTITSFYLVKDSLNAGKHKGYGFLEYESMEAANDAVGSMNNNFDLGGLVLRVRKAIAPKGMQIPAGSSFGVAPMMGSTTTSVSKFNPPPNKVLLPTPVGIMPSTRFANMPNGAFIPPQAILPPPGVVIPTIAPRILTPPKPLVTAAEAAAAEAEDESTQLPNTLSAQEDVKLSGVEARHMIMHKLMRRENTTRVMVLRNMVGVEDLDDDLQEEVTDECEKYGKVQRVVIYEEKQSEEEDAEVIVKIFVMFAEEDSCEKAIAALNGRWFGGKTVSATTFPQEKFDNSDWTD